MKKAVLIFGLISGAISAGMMLATVPFANRIGFDKGEILGYALIVLSALVVFFGVRSYRENTSGGRLTFGRGFADYPSFESLLCRYLGDCLFQVHAGLRRQLRCVYDRARQGLWRQPREDREDDPRGQPLQGDVQQPVNERGADGC